MSISDKKREIFGLFYFAAAIFSAVIFFMSTSKIGWLGGFLRLINFGLFGTVAYVLPLVFLYMAFDYFFSPELKITKQRFTAVLLLWVCSAVVITLFTTSQEQIKIAALLEGKASATLAVKYLWSEGAKLHLQAESFSFNGGLLGGLLATALRSVIGQTGALIFIFAMFLALLVLIFNLSFSKVLHSTADTITKTQDRVHSAVLQQVSDFKQQREMKQEVPRIRRIESEDYDFELPTNWQPAETNTGGRFYEPDATDDDQILTNEDHDDQASFWAQLAQTAQYSGTERPSSMDGFLTIDDLPKTSVKQEHDEIDYEIPSSASRSETVIDHQDQSVPVQELPEVEKHTQIRQERIFKEQAIAYMPPSLSLLKEDKHQQRAKMNLVAIKNLGKKLEQTLEDFKVQAKVVNFTTGPTITRFELTPGPGVKVSRIVNLADDIALNLAAMGVRIEAPIPGKAAIGVEIPNKTVTPVLLRSLLESTEFAQTKSPLTAALGRDVQGNPIFCDLTKMPHLLIAGATGSGKSVCINCILMSIIFKSSPEQVRMLMIDPKVVELSVYNGIPHLIQPVVTDPKKAFAVLGWAVDEMTRRYALFAEKSVRDITSYNSVILKGNEETEEKLPLILLVIDELSDLMATTPHEVEDAIARLTAMARAAGIHLIIATQRPSVDVITGVIKANIPSRISFAVASQIDSRTILDMGGAEKLLGKGDMLYSPQSAAKPVRGQGAFVSDSEVERVLQAIKNQYTADYDEDVGKVIAAAPSLKDNEDKNSQAPGEQDELLPDALAIVVETGYASVSLLQRKMAVGYPRAARLIDRLHEQGYIGPFEGSKPRKVLINMTQYMDMQASEEKEEEDL